MTLPLESALARFYTRTKKIEGAGLLVGSTTVLTCAHVVTRILGLPDNTHEPPTDVIYLDLPFVALSSKHEPLRARVLPTAWVAVQADGGGDMAGLELLDPLPVSATPAQLLNPTSVQDHRYEAIGFSANHNNGVRSYGIMRGRDAVGYIQLDGDRNYLIEGGFSGAPVWDQTLKGIVGIIALGEKSAASGFMIPTALLAQVWSAPKRSTSPPSPSIPQGALKVQFPHTVSCRVSKGFIKLDQLELANTTKEFIPARLRGIIRLVAPTGKSATLLEGISIPAVAAAQAVKIGPFNIQVSDYLINNIEDKYIEFYIILPDGKEELLYRSLPIKPN